MKLDPKDSDYALLSTGKRLYVNCGIIGLSPEGAVSGGYDNPVFHPDDDGKLTPAECIELADYMLAEWQKFRAAYA